MRKAQTLHRQSKLHRGVHKVVNLLHEGEQFVFQGHPVTVQKIKVELATGHVSLVTSSGPFQSVTGVPVLLAA